MRVSPYPYAGLRLCITTHHHYHTPPLDLHHYSMASQEDYAYLARLAERADRCDDMLSLMRKMIDLNNVLGVEERNLLAIASKNIVGPLRASWRMIASIEQHKETGSDKQQVFLINSYRFKIEKELKEACEDILGLLDEYLIPAADTEEAFVFYNKLKGDYYRYLAEFSSGDQRKNATNEALKAYSTASDSSKNELSPSDPLRIGLALNFSVFYYEIMNDTEKACKLAREGFDQAIMLLRTKVDDLSEESYRESLLIMNLLKDNLTLWVGDVPETAPAEQRTTAIAKGEEQGN